MRLLPKFHHRRLSLVAVLTLALLGSATAYGQSDLPSINQCRMLWDQENKPAPEIEGWCLFIDHDRGNCLACHSIAISNFPNDLAAAGNIGPLLHDISTRYRNKLALRNLISDPSIENPQTFMPLYGKHGILTRSEIDLIIKFLQTL